MLTLGVTAALLLWQAARGLRRRLGPGTTENSLSACEKPLVWWRVSTARTTAECQVRRAMSL